MGTSHNLLSIFNNLLRYWMKMCMSLTLLCITLNVTLIFLNCHTIMALKFDLNQKSSPDSYVWKWMQEPSILCQKVIFVSFLMYMQLIIYYLSQTERILCMFRKMFICKYIKLSSTKQWAIFLYFYHTILHLHTSVIPIV